MRHGEGRKVGTKEMEAKFQCMRDKTPFSKDTGMWTGWFEDDSIYVVWMEKDPWCVYFKELDLWVLASWADVWGKHLTGKYGVLTPAGGGEMQKLIGQGVPAVRRARIEGRLT